MSSKTLPKYVHLSWAAIIGAVVCSLIWSGQAVAAKVALDQLTPLWVVALRFLVAVPLLAGWVYWQGGGLAIAAGDLLLISGNAAVVALQVTLFTMGTDLTTSARAVVLIHTFPFFTILMAPLVLTETPRRFRQVVGALLGFAGVVAVLAGRLLEERPPSLWGDVLVLSAALLMGARIVLAKYLLRRLDAARLTFYSASWGVLICGPLAWLAEPWPESLETATIVGVLFQGMFVSAGAVLLWNTLLEHHSPGDLVVFRLATPILGTVWSFSFLGESISGSLIVGAILALAGGWVAARPSRSQSANRPLEDHTL